MSSLAKKEPNARTRRAARACARCHSRKVRCDGSITGFPCTNCRLDGRSCTLHSGKRDKEKQILKAITRERDMNPRSHPAPPSTSELHPGQTHLTSIRSQMALRVPVPEVLDVFTKHYFLYVHPFLPVVDEAVFWRKYRSVDAGSGKISTLLFQAMLFAASSFVPLEAAKKCGYDSLIAARDDLFRRAKRLYESGVEKDRVVIAQACLLLTFYTTESEHCKTNSHWLRLAILYAKKEQAHVYHRLPQSGLPSGRKMSDLKRLWWSCMIRDRIISLGVRRPLQITPDEFDLPQLGLSFQDLEDECFHSEVYTPDAKIALCRVLASLCHLAIAVTDLAMLVYPTRPSMPFSQADRRMQLNRLEETKFALLDWELSWVANPDGKEYYIHPSLTLHTNLCAIYFQSARIALCNRICLLVGYNTYITDETDLSRIESCRAELATAIRSTADNVKQILLHGVADKLPISAVAYTLLPQILLSIQTQLSTTPEDKQLHELLLVFFTEIFRFFRNQYYIRIVFAFSWKALELFQQSRKLLQSSSDTSNASNASSNNNELIPRAPLFTDLKANAPYYYPNLFQLKLTEYVRLLRYVDDFMSSRIFPGDAVIYSQLQPRRMPTHARTHSQAPSTSTSSTRRSVTATIADSDSSHDTSTIYSGDGETEDPTSPRWTDDYFWVYFGEKELEGNTPQTTTSATTISSISGSHNSGSGCWPTPGHESGVEAGAESGIEGAPWYLKGKQTDSEDRAASFENMLDCLPLLGE
ncbi:fungal-specific transcription factor domain-containing protein [Aspergillus varians]